MLNNGKFFDNKAGAVDNVPALVVKYAWLISKLRKEVFSNRCRQSIS